MITGDIKTMWGREFRVVPDGLAETDVVAFVERFMGEHRGCQEALQGVDSLRELATRTVDEAERLAERIKEQARSEEERRAGMILSEAKHRAEDIVSRAHEIASNRQDTTAPASALALVENGQTSRSGGSTSVQPAGGSVPEGPSSPAYEAAEKKAAEILDETRHQAEQQASTIISEAKEKARRITAESEKRSKVQAQNLVNAAVQVAHARVGEINAEVAASRAMEQSGQGGASNGSRQVLSWSPVVGADRYAVIVTEQPYGPGNVVFSLDDLTESQCPIPDALTPGIEYMWTVRAGGKDGWGPCAPYKALRP